MGKRIRINNLSDDTTAEDLQTLFSGVGTIVRARISREEENGESKGYGFVEMDTEDAAESAVTMLNGQTLKGREIRVGIARPPTAQGKSRSSRPPRIKRHK